jgi:hypothetical protein
MRWLTGKTRERKETGGAERRRVGRYSTPFWGGCPSCSFAVEHGERTREGKKERKKTRRGKWEEKGRRDKLVAQREGKKNDRTKDRDVRRSHVLTP